MSVSACMRAHLIYRFLLWPELTVVASHPTSHGIYQLAKHACAMSILASTVLEVSRNAPACRSTRRSSRLSYQPLAGP